MTANEMVGWYHRLDGHEFEQALGNGDGPGCLVCCSPWSWKESDRTEETELNLYFWDSFILCILFIPFHFCILYSELDV